jgi:hypothetical protein
VDLDDTEANLIKTGKGRMVYWRESDLFWGWQDSRIEKAIGEI